jgi:branched-chain amino acid transport system substrate-binding protein
VLATAAATVLFATACGDDDAASRSDPSPSAGADLEGPPIRIAAMVDETGRTERQDGPSADVARAWAEWVNGEGGIGGHPVEVDVFDTRGDPAAATSAGTEAVDDESIVAAISVASVTESVFAPTFSEAGLPIVGGHGVSFAVWNVLPNVFPVVTTQMASVAGLTTAAHEIEGVDSLAAIVCAENPACAQLETPMRSFAEDDDIRFDGIVTVAADAPNYTAECLRLQDAGAEAVALPVGGAVAGRIVADCSAQGYDPVYVTSDGAVTLENVQLITDAGGRVVGTSPSFPWWSDSGPAQTYRQVMDDAGIPEEDYANSATAAAWASLELFRAAMEPTATEATGGLTREDVLAAYGDVRDETLDGLLPQPMTITPGEPGPGIYCSWYYAFDGSEFSSPKGDDPACVDPSLAEPVG